jgi:hypothetical protein
VRAHLGSRSGCGCAWRCAPAAGSAMVGLAAPSCVVGREGRPPWPNDQLWAARIERLADLFGYEILVAGS